MGVLDGDALIGEVAGNAHRRAQRKDRAYGGGLDDDAVQMERPFSADVGGGTDKTGCLFQRRFPFHADIDIHAAGQPGDQSPPAGAGEKDIGVSGELVQVGGAEETGERLEDIESAHVGASTPVSRSSRKRPRRVSRKGRYPSLRHTAMTSGGRNRPRSLSIASFSSPSAASK